MRDDRNNTPLLNLARNLRHDCRHYLVDCHLGTVDNERIIRRLERRYCTFSISRITFLDLREKGAQINTQTFVFQLVIASFRPRLSRRIEKDLYRRIWENHGSHIAPVGYEAGRFAKALLQGQNGRPNRRQRCHLRGAVTRFLAANRVGIVSAIYGDLAVRKNNVQALAEGD